MQIVHSDFAQTGLSPCISIAPLGHCLAHKPHPVHSSPAIKADVLRMPGYITRYAAREMNVGIFLF